MLQKISLLLCVACAIVLVGCAKTETTTNSNIATAATPKPATSTAPSTATTATAGEKIGVPECDQYLAAYDACVSSKVPETARAQYKTSFEQIRASWKKLADNPQTKASLTAACKTATEQARTSMKAYGCTF